MKKCEGSGWTMYLGDCLAHVVEAEHTITDPPYGFGAYQTDQDGGRVVERLLAWRAKGATAVFGYPENLVAWCIDLGWRPDEWIVWWPTNAAAKAGGRHKGVPRQTEHIAIFGETPGASDIVTARSLASIKKPQNEGLPPEVRIGDVWQDASPGIGFNCNHRLHPNEKPIDLLLKAVRLVSAPGDLIADPFAGSGTTGVAALRLGRRFVGCELDEAHFRTTCERLRAEESGSTLAARRAGQEALFGGAK
jgi:hypothetical protein